MIRRPPRSTRTDTLFPYPTLFRSRVLIYCLYNEEAMEAGRDIDALASNPTAGDWRATAPCEAEDVDWMNKRSEEHTSELQSLMRISYAVFCLKKKKKTITNHRRKYKRIET